MRNGSGWLDDWACVSLYIKRPWILLDCMAEFEGMLDDSNVGI